MPVPAGSRPNEAPTAISSSARLDSSGPRKKSAEAIWRVPRALATSTWPSSSARTDGISPEGSAWAIEPTVVPRLRMTGWATLSRAWRRRGSAAWAPSCRSSWACRTRAPMRTASCVTSTSAEAGHPVDVHQVGRRGEAHVEDRDEALAAGEDLAVVAHLGEDGDGLIDAARGVVHEGRGLHRADPAFPKGGLIGAVLTAVGVGGWQLLPTATGDSTWAVRGCSHGPRKAGRESP